MDFEIIIRNATLEESKELLAALPKGTVITQKKESTVVPVGPLSKWKIPFNFRTEKKLYQNAWCLCRKHNLPYPEAILLKKKASPVTTEPAKLPPYKNHSPVTMDEIPKSENIEKWKVRQIKADGQRFVKGIMTVTTRKNGSGLIECLHEGKRQIIDAACLEVVERI